jgi:predicted nucleic acid-binding protein
VSSAHRDGIGRPIQAMDALIAATAQAHQLVVVTRNGDDFDLSVRTINPWS